MPVFIVLLIAVILIIVVVRKNKRKHAIEELKNGAGYEVAVKIKDELTAKGFRIGDISLDYDSSGAYGSFFISSEETSFLGKLKFSTSGFALQNDEHGLQRGNIESRIHHNYKYAIENANLGLLVCSMKESQEVPLFLEIAAEVIKNSGYVFKHPGWIHEDPAKEYLNVMFQ
jgi:hypothetical protein